MIDPFPHLNIDGDLHRKWEEVILIIDTRRDHRLYHLGSLSGESLW